ncbi:hypothetical protein TNCV_4688441 [Trichonephila clavipes]|nr:hypothetical protein TNCV_4688441 [Trichonephila clavipes]
MENFQLCQSKRSSSFRSILIPTFLILHVTKTRLSSCLNVGDEEPYCLKFGAILVSNSFFSSPARSCSKPLLWHLSKNCLKWLVERKIAPNTCTCDKAFSVNCFNVQQHGLACHVALMNLP